MNLSLCLQVYVSLMWSIDHNSELFGTLAYARKKSMGTPTKKLPNIIMDILIDK
jgi:hypothetical protein